MQDFAQEFEKIYKNPEEAPWTFKEPHPELVDLVNKQKIPAGCKVLEIACGEGYHSIFLASSGFKVTALDRSPLAIRYAKQHAKEANVEVEFLVKDYRDLYKFSGTFDFIFDWRFLHEITDEKERREYVQNIARLLDKEGKYLSVAFSGEFDYWGTGKFRTSPTGIILYFATIDDMLRICSPNFNVVEKKIIRVPQKPDLQIPAYYVLLKKK